MTAKPRLFSARHPVKNAVQSIIKFVLASQNLTLIRIDNLDDQVNRALQSGKVDLLASVRPPASVDPLDVLVESKSQIGQDFFVLDALDWKRGGFFVEFGATDGVALSNTYLLEKLFGWTGILAEPSPWWHNQLSASGRTAVIDHDCVWRTSGEQISFEEATRPELSTMRRFSKSDLHKRTKRSSVQVPTISLNDLLEKHNAPDVIDYLSIDTEGSEFDILEAFDFGKRRFRCITCEHNFTPKREAIFNLLVSKGYERVKTAESQFDDWYVWRG